MSNLAEAKQALIQKKTIPNTGIIYTAPIQATYKNPYATAVQKIQAQIKELRKQKGWSQRDLAKESGVSQGTITRAERHMWVSLNTLLVIIAALGGKLTIEK